MHRCQWWFLGTPRDKQTLVENGFWAIIIALRYNKIHNICKSLCFLDWWGPLPQNPWTWTATKTTLFTMICWGCASFQSSQPIITPFLFQFRTQIQILDNFIFQLATRYELMSRFLLSPHSTNKLNMMVSSLLHCTIN